MVFSEKFNVLLSYHIIFRKVGYFEKADFSIFVLKITV